MHRVVLDFLLAFGVFLNVPAVAAQAPWTGPLEAARAAHFEGRHGEAARLFAEADRVLGGFPYEDEDVDRDEQGAWLHARERMPVREALQCPWALSVLAEPPGGESLEAADPRADALVRAELSCDPVSQGVAADLRGDPLLAAWRLRGAPFPAPFAARVVSEQARAWARAVLEGAVPRARDVEEARRFVQAHAAAEHGLSTQCAEPTRAPFSRSRRGSERTVDEGVPVALALVRCTYAGAVSPYEPPRMGPGAASEIYLLASDADGVRIAGHFRGFWDEECWTGVVQRELGARVVRQAGHPPLHVLEREEGFREEGIGVGEVHLTREAVVCDVARGACRTLPFGLETRALDFGGGRPVPVRRRWRSRVAFRDGAVRLLDIRGAPASLQCFGGTGVPLDAFFSAPPMPRDQLSWESAPSPAADVVRSP